MMQTFIRANFTGATFIQLWRMESPRQQQAWLRAMHDRIHLLQSKPGFQSMTLLPSLDGLNVVVYAQWASPEKLKGAVTNAQVLTARTELDSHGQPDGTLFRVDSVNLPEEVIAGSIPIERESRALVFVNMWATQSEQRQRNLLEQMKSETAGIITKPGSRGMAYHTSLDGTRLAVFALWDSAADFDAAITDSKEPVKNRNTLAQFGEPTANTYRVDSVNLSTTLIDERS